MKKQHLPNRSFLTNFVMLTILLIFLFVSNIFSQVIINEKVEIKPGFVLPDTSNTKKRDLFRFIPNSTDNEESTLLMPVDGTITIEVLESESAAQRISLEMRQPPDTLIICEYANDTIGFKWTSEEFEEGTLVEFGIDWYWNYYGEIYGGKEAGVDTTKINDYEYIFGFECGGVQEWDYNELVISVKINLDSLDVKVEPDTIYPGDTAQVIIKKRLPDGTLIDFDSTQTYEVGMLDGCILGTIKTISDSGYYVYNVTQPIYFIADTAADTTGTVMLRVGLVEQTNKPQNKYNQQTDLVESDCFIGGQFGSYDDVNIYIPDPLIIRYPTPETIEWITEEPQMPSVTCWAEYCRNFTGVVKYEWKYIVRKFYARRGGATCIRVSKSEFQGVSYSLGPGLTLWDVPFNKDSGYFYFKAVQPKQNKWHPQPYYGCNNGVNYWYDTTSDEIFTGGEVLITLIAKNYQTGDVLARLDTVHLGKILGLSPNPSTVEAYANSNKIKAIIWKETGGTFKQFTGDPLNNWWPYNEAGWPLYGVPNGYGLTQLDNNLPATERQQWNWKANIDGGKQKLTDSYNEVAEDHGAPNEDKYNWTNAFHNYNHGNGSKYWKWKGRIIGWKEEPDIDHYGNDVYIKYTEYGGGN